MRFNFKIPILLFTSVVVVMSLLLFLRILSEIKLFRSLATVILPPVGLAVYFYGAHTLWQKIKNKIQIGGVQKDFIFSNPFSRQYIKALTPYWIAVIYYTIAFFVFGIMVEVFHRGYETF